MKKEYDFTTGKRGKFFQENLTLEIPVYLNSENFEYVKHVADENDKDINTIVNDIIREGHDVNRIR